MSEDLEKRVQKIVMEQMLEVVRNIIVPLLGEIMMEMRNEFSQRIDSIEKRLRGLETRVSPQQSPQPQATPQYATAPAMPRAQSQVTIPPSPSASPASMSPAQTQSSQTTTPSPPPAAPQPSPPPAPKAPPSPSRGQLYKDLLKEFKQLLGKT
ncbi:MAG: hypothetical protein ACTSXJ_02860 [Candidatus Baldrarchaeia archaeon]